jgi:uncharacterized protein (DUF433 family)
MSDKHIISETKNNRVFVTVVDTNTGKKAEASQSYGVIRTESAAKTDAIRKACEKLLDRAQTNIQTGITKTPGVVGGDACIRNMRIPVWSLVKYRQMGANDGKIIEAYPQLTAADLDNAWAYAEAFSTEIAQAIAVNLKN